MHPDWVRDLRDFAQKNGIGFEYKQWGEWAPLVDHPGADQTAPTIVAAPDGHGIISTEGRPLKPQVLVRVGKRAAGRVLDGKTWDEWPTGVEPFGSTLSDAEVVARLGLDPDAPPLEIIEAR